MNTKTQAGAGRASLALEGHEIAPGRALRIGTLEDLKETKAEIRDDRSGSGSNKSVASLPPPTHVRRPGVGAGRRGGKGGLGVKKGGSVLNGEGATSGELLKPEEVGEGDEEQKLNGKPKNNADFKAMMLKR